MEKSYPHKGTNVLPTDNRKLAEQISAVVLKFSAKQLGKAANRTSEAAKKWRQGSVTPDLASAINMGRDIPAIKWLIIAEMERGTPEGVVSPRLMVEAMQLLAQLADGDGEHSAKARSILKGRSE